MFSSIQSMFYTDFVKFIPKFIPFLILLKMEFLLPFSDSLGAPRSRFSKILLHNSTVNPFISSASILVDPLGFSIYLIMYLQIQSFTFSLLI